MPQSAKLQQSSDFPLVLVSFPETALDRQVHNCSSAAGETVAQLELSSHPLDYGDQDISSTIAHIGKALEDVVAAGTGISM